MLMIKEIFFSFTKYHHMKVEGMLVFLEYLNWLCQVNKIKITVKGFLKEQI